MECFAKGEHATSQTANGDSGGPWVTNTADPFIVAVHTGPLEFNTKTDLYDADRAAKIAGREGVTEDAFDLDELPLAPASPATCSAGSAANVTASGVGGMSPLVAGPDGRLWMLSFIQTDNGSGDAWQSVDPSTGAVTSSALLTGNAETTGGMAFDSAGQIWQFATGEGGTNVLVRATTAGGSFDVFPLPAVCQGSAYPSDQITSSPDGYLWTSCGKYLVRVASDGAMDAFPVYDGDSVSSGAALAASADGTMWAVAANSGGTPLGLLEISPGGDQKFFRDSAGEESFWVAGNGTDVDDVVFCGPDLTDTCYDKVAADGAKTQLTDMPNGPGVTYLPSMDQHGDVWEWFSPDAGATGPTVQSYFEVTPAGATAVIPFKSSMTGPTGPPVVAADGAIWVEQNEPNTGDLLRVVP
jgi:hypothetical protein